LSKSSIFETNGFLSNVVVELSENLPELKEEEITVIHGDVNHKNWLVDDESDKVYLVDWDTVLLSSPLVDI
ncbi:phosphotransferase, partial [Bifidobacterium pseudocatenulatum]|nr:phosphotransferase [Bifidobacterium pseudocatenulatum]